MSSSLFEVLRLSKKQQRKLLAVVPRDEVLSEGRLLTLLEPLGLGKQQLARVKEALAIAYYHVQTNMPIVDILICDDAPQFKLLTDELGLCWVHDGRHYKKINPYLEHNQLKLDDFLGKRYWPFYRKLLAYKLASADERIALAVKLTNEFDELFSIVTGYQDLDERIAKTLAKKQELLLVLKYPGLPLHNNPAELGARSAVKKRDVSLQTRSADGTKAQDTFLTITETAKKLGVNTYDYLFDRISGTYTMPSLADIIRQRTQDRAWAG
jgi:DNA-directed RNA polymerase subunit H (RpoH/RPB5)